MKLSREEHHDVMAKFLAGEQPTGPDGKPVHVALIDGEGNVVMRGEALRQFIVEAVAFEAENTPNIEKH